MGHHRRRKDRKKEPAFEGAVTELFTGIGFVVAAIAILAFVPSGVFWWWSLLIPASALLGESVGKYLRWQEHQREQASLKEPGNQIVAHQSTARERALSAPKTSELVKPPSVTEQTTRHPG